MFKKVFTSKVFLIIIISYATVTSFQNKRWETKSIIHDDVINYYAYLPAAFIYHDLTFSYIDSLPDSLKNKIYSPRTKDNRIVQKMTMGESILLLPFFTMAHLNSILNLLPANGYTPEYEFFIAVAALFYFALGLFFLRKSLMKYFRDPVVLITLLIVGLATNLFYYTTYECGMSHVYSFCLFSIFLWMTIRWHEKSSVKISVFTGLFFGLITLIRPTNCLVFVFFILYNITDTTSFANKIKILKEKWMQVLLIALFAFLPILLQMMYWKYATGHWLYYSYGDERFYFNHPHIWEGLFGFRNGFFIYTPAMIFIIPGIWMAFKKRERYWLALIIFFITNIYLIFSWWCWWYGGFGLRAMIDSYPFLALSLGTFISICFNSNNIVKLVVVIFTALFIKLNLFQTVQAKCTLLHWDAMNAKVYFEIFGRNSFPSNYELILTPSDPYNAYRGLPERDVFGGDINKINLLYTYKVTIKASNNKFVCDDVIKNGIIICNRDNAGEWETFLLNRYAGNVCTIQSFEKKYIGMDFNRNLKLFATKTKAEGTEIFRITDLNNNHFALKAHDGSFVTMNKDSSCELMAGAAKIGKTETFILEYK